MLSICARCGEFTADDSNTCSACGGKVVAVATTAAGARNMWRTNSSGAVTQSVGATPTAFNGTSAAPPPPPPRKEKATALYNFTPQDPQVQLRLIKGEEVEVIRKDADGWWFITKDDEKGLVPGSYLKLHNPVVVHVPEAAILAAREASNAKLQQLSTAASSNNSNSNAPNSSDSNASTARFDRLSVDDAANPQTPRAPGTVDAKSSDPEIKPTVRKLRKCFACRETILGRTKIAKNEIFHEICLLCPGCRESIEEDEEFTLIKKKAFHADCARDAKHCRVCDKEILGRVYKAGDGSFHRLCMICALCSQQADQRARFTNEQIVCHACITAQEEKEREDREAREAAERAIAQARAEKEAAEAAARALLEQKEREVAEAAARAKKEREDREERARVAAREAEDARRAQEAADAAAAAAAANRNRRGASHANLDEFDLGATPHDGYERASEISDFGSELGSDYSFMTNNRDSLRLSQVLDLESIDAFTSSARSSRGFDRLSTLSDMSALSDRTSDARGGNAGRSGGVGGHPSSLREDSELLSDDDGEQEMCGGCNQVLEGEAVGALNRYFHYECFKCNHCRRVIAEDDGYAEKDNQAYHQNCYQAKFGKRCCRCTQTLKGKVVKALDNLYHPGCFVCFNCSSSLSESFFEHDGQAVCAKCKHSAITHEEPSTTENLTPISTATVGYQFSAQDDTQLTINPGEELAILQKDDDGWWLVELHNKRGYVPGSYLVEHPPKPASKPAAAAAKPGLCSECSTQNPDVARFCRTCGNQLIA